MDTQTAVNEPKTGTMALSKQEAARALGISLRTIDRLIALKELPVRRLGRRVLISRASLESFFRNDHPTQIV
jgi:excisionase family DNA binding protein